MASNDSSLNTAHHYASNADDYLAQGLYIPAAEQHYKAAEAFLACVDQSKDEQTKRTLRMLYNDHCKAGKELQRKIAQLKEEGKDPALPQLPAVAKRNPSSAAANGASHSPSPSAFSRAGGRMIDSQATVDESFMVLGGQRSDPGDAFNQFWHIMEGMLDNLSQPVAFATAPLGPSPRVDVGGGSSSDTDADDTMATRLSRRLNAVTGGGSFGKKSGQVAVPPVDEFDEVFADDDDDSSDSFCLVPSSSGPSSSSLRKENASLKSEVGDLQKRLAATERVLQLRKEQDAQLRDSIVMARREAQRAMGASTLGPRLPAPSSTPLDLGSLNINATPSPPGAFPLPIGTGRAGRDREAGFLQRIRDLEEDVRILRSENDKQKQMIARFRERWEKLKESAKRKKEAKAAAAGAGGGVRERIDEEPEAEQELDEQNQVQVTS